MSKITCRGCGEVFGLKGWKKRTIKEAIIELCKLYEGHRCSKIKKY